MVRPDPRIHGDITGCPVGLLFADREDLYNAGVHGTKESGIFGTKAEGGAFSIVINNGYEDDDDRGDAIIYTGEGKGKPAKGQPLKPGQNTQQGPQDMKSHGNAALARNVDSKLSVRVIRGPNGNIEYCPRQGYRYDGLYDVVRAYMEEGKAGFKMCRFELKRCEDIQDPLPLHIRGDGVADKYWSLDGTENLGAEKQYRSPRIPSSGPIRTRKGRRSRATGSYLPISASGRALALI